MKSSQVKAWYIVFINSFVGCAIAATFPQFSMTVGNLAEKTGISESMLLTSDTVRSCGIVLAMIIAGYIYNKFGARKVFVFSTFAAIIPQLLFLHISDVWILMILKFIQGLASVIFPVFITIIIEWVEEKNLGLSTAIFNGIFFAGGGIGGTIAGIVIANSSWEMSYYAMAIFQAVFNIIWFLTVKEKKSRKEELSSDTEAVIDEKKPNLLLSSKMWLLAISFFATTWTVQAITVDLSVYSSSLGYEEFETAKLLTAVTVGMIVSCLVSGKTSDFFARRSNRKDISRILVLIFGYILVLFSVIFIIFADTGNFSILYAAVLLLTFGASWGLGAFYSILPEIYDDKTVPIVTGITGGIGDAGMPLAPLVVGVAFGINGMWEIGWGTCAVISAISSLAAVILIFMLRKQR